MCKSFLRQRIEYYKNEYQKYLERDHEFQDSICMLDPRTSNHKLNKEQQGIDRWLPISQEYLTFLYYFICDIIVCVLVTFFQ